MGIMVWENLFQRRTAPQQGEHQGVNVKQVRESSEKIGSKVHTLLFLRPGAADHVLSLIRVEQNTPEGIS